MGMSIDAFIVGKTPSGKKVDECIFQGRISYNASKMFRLAAKECSININKKTFGNIEDAIETSLSSMQEWTVSEHLKYLPIIIKEVSKPKYAKFNPCEWSSQEPLVQTLTDFLSALQSESLEDIEIEYCC